MSVRKNTLDGLFAGIEDITDAGGRVVNTVLYSQQGNCSSIIETENPVPQYCADADRYYAFMNVLDQILQTLGEGHLLQTGLSPRHHTGDGVLDRELFSLL